MASSYSLTKQSFKEKLGRSHVTLDEQFNASWANCQQLEDIVDRIRTHMTDYMESMKGQRAHTGAEHTKSIEQRSPAKSRPTMCVRGGSLCLSACLLCLCSTVREWSRRE